MTAFLIFLLVSFMGTYYVMPHSIRKLRQNGYVVKDMYKHDKPEIPTNAGIILIFTSFLSISLVPLIIKIFNLISTYRIDHFNLDESNFAFLLVISIYALYGLVDDLVDIGRVLKLLIPVTFAFPLISVVSVESIWIPLLGDYNLSSSFYGEIMWNDLFRIIIIPIYVMVVANLVNMHSGYNGLQTGLSIILILAITTKSYYDGSINEIVPMGAMLGSFLAFFFFNKFPSKAFEGNIGSLFFGSTIGCLIVVQKYWWFGFVILIPHIFNFILWIIWLGLMKSKPEVYTIGNGEHKKFGSVLTDGTIEVPNTLTLKWIPNYYWKMDEPTSTFVNYFITLIFCFLGLIFL